MRIAVLFVAVVAVLFAGVAMTQTPAPAPNPEGAAVFQRDCASCHINPAADSRAPTREALGSRTADAIVAALTDGAMRLQGARLNDRERRSVAAFLTVAANQRTPAAVTAETASICRGSVPYPAAGPQWNGWGASVTNTRFQTSQQSGLTAAQVPNLKLKWAFGIDGVVQARVQPVIVGGRVFIASESGAVYSLDAKTGCTYWIFRAESGIRTAISAGPGGAIFFADAKANAYAVDATTGRQLWIRKVEDHPSARATGSPTFYDGRLYVPITGVAEENTAGRPEYECCTFRGSLSALDAATGAVLWKAYTVDEPKPRGKSTTGAQLYGPAGGGIWSAPTIDVGRGLIYVATGNGYADPPQPTTDAVVAFDLKTGKLKWASQVTPKDNWALGCGNGPVKNPNCPEAVGPDYDFSASPILATLANGRQLIVIPQKSGLGYALDPDKEGALVWKYQAGRGSGIGGVWGATVDQQQAYFAVADQRTPAPGGLHAVNIATGERVWYTAPKTPLCGSGPGCSAAQSAALTAIPGVVFSGSADGGLRGYSTKDGSIIWEFNTNRDFETVNGVKARGGSMDLGGPAVVGGMLFAGSGNGGIVGMPGNVLLAFGVE